MSGAIRVKGLGDMNRALARTSKDVRLGIRKELREVGKPIGDEAQHLARSNISGLRKRVGKKGRDWSKMRVGATLDLVYVVPRQRGLKSGPRKRRDFADLMMNDAMQPALDHHGPDIEREVDKMLGRVSERFSL